MGKCTNAKVVKRTNGKLSIAQMGKWSLFLAFLVFLSSLALAFAFAFAVIQQALPQLPVGGDSELDRGEKLLHLGRGGGIDNGIGEAHGRNGDGVEKDQPILCETACAPEQRKANANHNTTQPKTERKKYIILDKRTLLLYGTAHYTTQMHKRMHAQSLFCCQQIQIQIDTNTTLL